VVDCGSGDSTAREFTGPAVVDQKPFGSSSGARIQWDVASTKVPTVPAAPQETFSPVIVAVAALIVTPVRQTKMKAEAPTFSAWALSTVDVVGIWTVPITNPSGISILPSTAPSSVTPTSMMSPDELMATEGGFVPNPSKMPPIVGIWRPALRRSGRAVGTRP